MVYDKNKRLLALYGITLEDYEKMLESQNGGCAICGRVPTGRALHVDHDHKTGLVRGLLCHSCNHAIGRRGFNDSSEKCLNAAAYLSKYGT